MRGSLLSATALLSVCMSLALAADKQPAADYGKKLFNDPALGGSKNPTSCNSCHNGGKGLGKAADRPDLAGVINHCISTPLKGEKIYRDSVEMKSLILYIKSLKPV